MKPELKNIALQVYKPPFTYRSGYIWDAKHKMVADRTGGDHQCFDEGTGYALRIRGWGHIQYMETEFPAGDIQDAIGELIAQAMTDYWRSAGVKDYKVKK